MSDAITTEDVQEQFVAGAMLTGLAYNRDEAREWFDEWLESHTRHMQSRVLIEEAEIADGKHKARLLDAWDFKADQPALCQCECHKER